MNIEKNVEILKQEIENIKLNNKITSPVKILAATKYVGTEAILRLLNCGIYDLGENKVQDFLKKYEFLQNETTITWHFIGSLQTNKVSKIINKIHYLHSLDRENLAIEINKHAINVVNCFVEVNLSGEDSKHGLKPETVIHFIKEMVKYPKIRIVGLMTMAENTTNDHIIRHTYSSLKKIQKEVLALNLPYAPCSELSMGMSNDYTLAILEGSTLIRIGSRLFRI